MKFKCIFGYSSDGNNKEITEYKEEDLEADSIKKLKEICRENGKTLVSFEIIDGESEDNKGDVSWIEIM